MSCVYAKFPEPQRSDRLTTLEVPFSLYYCLIIFIIFQLLFLNLNMYHL